MKLELKHLAPYLPYGLTGIIDDDPRYDPETMVGLDTLTQISTDIDCRDYSNFKPLLRPLSDLTKEIEHNGERFVPLLELSKISFPGLNDKREFIVVENHIDMGHDYSFHYNKQFNSFHCYTCWNGKSYEYACAVSNQLEMFQKLFEWKFDTFNLIESGLAIKITD